MNDFLMVLHDIVLILSGFMTIVLFIAALFVSIEDEENANKLLNMAIASLVICIVAIITYSVGMSKCEKSKWVFDEQPYAVENIAALSDSNMTNGKFYMRRGYIESDLYYQYMVKLGGGGFKANKVKADNATIFHDTDNYRVEWYKKTKRWLYFKNTETCQKIYIPEGSISEDYSIDLK